MGQHMLAAIAERITALAPQLMLLHHPAKGVFSSKIATNFVASSSAARAPGRHTCAPVLGEYGGECFEGAVRLGSTTAPPVYKTYEDHIREAGFTTTATKNSGTGAARRRIEAVRRLFPRMWFNLSTTEGGRLALGYYHERRDETRNIGLGPEHDFFSHAADAFGLMALSYEESSSSSDFNRVIEYPRGAVY